MRAKVVFSDHRKPQDFGGLVSAHQHGSTGTACLKTEAREFELEEVKCLHVYPEDGGDSE